MTILINDVNSIVEEIDGDVTLKKEAVEYIADWLTEEIKRRYDDKMISESPDTVTTSMICEAIEAYEGGAR